MYRWKKGVKQNPERRWNRPDRAFFAGGACHILAYAFIKRYPDAGFQAIWMKPEAGFTGNHIVAVSGTLAFDFHGYSNWDALVAHARRKSQRWWAGWECTLIPLPTDVLISEAKSKTFDGLWLRQPDQFLHNALPRAERFIDRYPTPNSS